MNQQDRPYQVEAKKQIAEHFLNGAKRVLLVLPTGGGKTKIFCDILKGAADKGNRSAMVVRGRELVEQASQRLFREGALHGVRQANHWNKRYGAPIQVCSIDTLIARNDRPQATILVIDEAHLFTSPKCVEFMEAYPDAYVLAVTATPYTRESLRHMADVVVKSTSLQELIDLGYCVGPRVYAPSTPDLKGVRTQSGDYVNAQLEERMNSLTGDIPGHWFRLGESRATIMFAVNIHHSMTLVEQFRRAGIPAEHIEGDTPAAERKRVLERLRRGEIKVVSNVGVLCTGVDLPFVSCLIGARPTKSYNLYIQQAGRGTRICPEIGKRDFIYLDHAGNTLRHGFITQEREVILDGKPKSDEFEGPQPRTCFGCYAIVEKFPCSCGWIPPKVERTTAVELAEGVLEEIKHIPEALAISQFVAQMKQTARDKGYRMDWVYYKVRDKYGEDVAKQIKLPKYTPSWVVRRP